MAFRPLVAPREASKGKQIESWQLLFLFFYLFLIYSSLFGSAAAATHYGAASLTPHSPSEAKSGYPYFGQLSSMEAGLCGRVH